MNYKEGFQALLHVRIAPISVAINVIGDMADMKVMREIMRLVRRGDPIPGSSFKA